MLTSLGDARLAALGVEAKPPYADALARVQSNRQRTQARYLAGRSVAAGSHSVRSCPPCSVNSGKR